MTVHLDRLGETPDPTPLPTEWADGLEWRTLLDIDVVARPRWPLDEARALSDPSHRPGRKGAKA